MTRLVLGIDEGTTAVKAALFDERLRPVREARRDKVNRHPRPGWVEQDGEEVLRAVVEAVGAVRETVDVAALRVDGGLTNEPLMLALQADAIGAPVEAGGADATVAGAAALAAVGAGVLGSLHDAAELLPVDRHVDPRRDAAWRETEHARWRAFVAAAAELTG